MRIISAISILLLATGISSAQNKTKTSGFIDLNYYPVLTDVDQDTFLTVNALVNLPARLQYFSFTNIAGNDSRNPFSSNNQYYSEQNLRWQIEDDSPLDLTVQWNLRSGSENDRLRLGFRWRLDDTSRLQDFFDSLHLAYSINFHAIQFDHESPSVWQMEHVFRMTFPLLERSTLSIWICRSYHQWRETRWRPQRPYCARSAARLSPTPTTLCRSRIPHQ